MVANDLSIPRTQVFEIVTENFTMWKAIVQKRKAKNGLPRPPSLCERRPRLFGQCENRMTGDGTWIFDYESESKL